MPQYRSRTSTAGRNMAGARALWRATGMKNEDFGKPIIAVANSFTQFVPGHVHLKDLGQLVCREIEQAGFPAWNDAFKAATSKFQNKKTCAIGQAGHHADFFIKCAINPSPLRLIERLAVKLTLNTLSTGTMVRVGRVADNWMSWVSVSNKKLIDRGIRLISELCSMSYRDACHALFESMEELSQIDFSGREEPSPVQYTIQKYKA